MIQVDATDANLMGLGSGSSAKSRNLGAAILLAAISDYRWGSRSATKFLYPQTPQQRTHYGWAVSLMRDANPDWLRESLDKSRPMWDAERDKRNAKRRVM